MKNNKKYFKSKMINSKIILMACSVFFIFNFSGLERSSAAVAIDEPSKKNQLNDPGDRVYKILVAEIASLRNDFKTSIEYYKSIKDSMYDPLVLERIMSLAFQSKVESQYESIAEQWVKIDGKNITALEALAIAQIKNKNIDAAVPSLVQLVEQLQSQNKNAYAFILAELKDLLGYKDLIYIFNRLGALDVKKNGTGYFFAASLSAEENNIEDALNILNDAMLLDANNIDYMQLHAHLLWRNNDISGAIKFLEKKYVSFAIDADNKLDSGLLYVNFLLQNFEYEKAKTVLTSINKAFPNDADVLSLLFLIAVNSQNYHLAKHLLTQIITLDQDKSIPLQINLYKRLAEQEKIRILLSQGNDEKVNFSRQMIIAETFLAEKNILSFTAHLDNLRGIFPNEQQNLYIQQIELLENYNYLEEAYLLNSLLIQYYPDKNNFLLTKAMLALKLNRFDEFEAIYREQIKLSPNNAGLLNGLAYTIFEQEKKSLYKEAKVMMLKAYDIDPNNMAITDSLGWMYYQLGDYKNASKYLTIAYNQMKEPDIIAHYLAVLMKTGRNKEALELFQIVEKIYPDNKYILLFKNNVLRAN